MAWFRDDEADVQETVDEAGRAHAEARTAFVARLRMKYERRDAGPVPLAAALIEGVEQAGATRPASPRCGPGTERHPLPRGDLRPRPVGRRDQRRCPRTRPDGRASGSRAVRPRMPPRPGAAPSRK
ncbi:hypothetical protein Pve01_05090 [Planomonospora venezuelensis]|nr:hypothetical protein Pve01_05090 [Planomonospora venezuelensis]